MLRIIKKYYLVVQYKEFHQALQKQIHQKNVAGICKLNQDYLIIFSSKLLISSWMKACLTGKIIRYSIKKKILQSLKDRIVEMNDATNNLP